jgi:hypothetical protein
MKMLEGFWGSVVNADKKHLFGLNYLLKPFLIHVVHQEISVGQQIIAWKIITVMAILVISIRTALPVIGTEITLPGLLDAHEFLKSSLTYDLTTTQFWPLTLSTGPCSSDFHQRTGGIWRPSVKCPVEVLPQE